MIRRILNKLRTLAMDDEKRPSRTEAVTVSKALALNCYTCHYQFGLFSGLPVTLTCNICGTITKFDSQGTGRLLVHRPKKQVQAKVGVPFYSHFKDSLTKEERALVVLDLQSHFKNKGGL